MSANHSERLRFFHAVYTQTFAFKPRASLPASHLLCSIPGPDHQYAFAGRQHSLSCIHSSTNGSFSSLAVTIFGRNTFRECATLQVCWLMLKNIEPSMRSPRHSLFCARHAPRFSSHPLTSSRAGHPCCPCTGCCHARAAAATSTLPSSSHPAIPRKQTSTSSSAQKFSPPAVNGSLRSARGCVLWC